MSTFTEEQQVTLLDRVIQGIENGDAPGKVLKNEYKAFLHKEGTEGLAPLHVACMEEHVDMLVALYDMDVHDLDVYDAFGMNGVLHCAKNGRLQALEWLIQHGADVRAKTVENDRSVLHYLAKFPVADCRRVSRMAQLVAGGGVDCDAKTRKQGYTAAHYAVLHGNVNSLGILSDIGCNIDLACNNGMTPAQLAAQLGHVDQLVFLLEQGASTARLKATAAEYPPDIAAALANTRALSPEEAKASVRARVHPPTPAGSPREEDAHATAAATGAEAAAAAAAAAAAVAAADDPLVQALAQGSKADLQRLVKKEGKEVLRNATADGRPPLHVAAAAANLEVCTALLDRYKTPADTPDAAGNTALLAAAATARPAALDVCSLLVAKGADPRVIGPLGPLMNLLAAIVADRDRVTLYKEILETAMRKGASITALSNGWLPMHAAAAAGNIACVLVLLENGCAIDCQAADGSTPIQVAVAHEQVSLAKFLSSRGASLEAVGAGGGQLSQELQRMKPAARPTHSAKAAPALGEEEELGRQQLQAAVCKGARADVKRLLKKLPARALAAANDEGSNVLHIATMLGHSDLVLLLLKHGAEANLPTAAGATALHLASRQGALDACKALLEHGADPTATLPDGDTALHLLLRAPAPTGDQGLLQEEIVRLLLERGGDAAALSAAGHSAAQAAAYLGNAAALAAMARAPRPEAWLEARSVLGEAALQLAAFRDRSAVVEQLAAAGASVSAAAADVRMGLGSWGALGGAALSLQSLTGEQLQTSAAAYALARLSSVAGLLQRSAFGTAEPQPPARRFAARPPLSLSGPSGAEAAKQWTAAVREAAGGKPLSQARLGELFAEAGAGVDAGNLEQLHRRCGGDEGLTAESFSASLAPALLLFCDAPTAAHKGSRRREPRPPQQQQRRREKASATSPPSSASTSPRVAELEAEVRRLKAALDAANSPSHSPANSPSQSPAHSPSQSPASSPPHAQAPRALGQRQPQAHLAAPAPVQRLPRPPQQPRGVLRAPGRAASLASTGKRKSWATRSNRSLAAMAAVAAEAPGKESNPVRAHFAQMFSRLANADGGGHVQVATFERHFLDPCTSSRLLNTIVPTVMLEKDLAVPGISEEAFTDFFYSEQQAQVVALEKLLAAQAAVEQATAEVEAAYEGFSSVDKFRSRTYLSETARSLLASLASVGAAHAAVMAATDEPQASTPLDTMLEEVRGDVGPALAAYGALLLPRAMAPAEAPPAGTFVAELRTADASAAAALQSASRRTRAAHPECLHGVVKECEEGATLMELWTDCSAFEARAAAEWWTAATSDLSLSASFTAAQVP